MKPEVDDHPCPSSAAFEERRISGDWLLQQEGPSNFFVMAAIKLDFSQAHDDDDGHHAAQNSEQPAAAPLSSLIGSDRPPHSPKGNDPRLSHDPWTLPLNACLKGRGKFAGFSFGAIDSCRGRNPPKLLARLIRRLVAAPS